MQPKILLCVLIPLLVACGQTGPLYLPEPDAQSESRHVPAAEYYAGTEYMAGPEDQLLESTMGYGSF